MKTNYFNVLTVAGGLLLGSSLLFTACSDDKEQPNISSGKNLAFSANIEENYQSPVVASRAGGGALTTATVETIDGATTSNGDQLYLHTLETDSIGAPLQQVDGSRATPITTATMYNSFGLIGYSYDNSSTWSTSLGATLVPDFYQAPATKNTSNIWQAPTAHWAEGKRMAVFAYAPFGNTSMSFTPSSATTAGAPAMAYTVPANVADQVDVLVADTLNVNFNGVAIQPLRFRHALTAVRFVTDNGFIGGTVTEIKLKNVYSTATYDMTSNSGTGGWSNYTATDTYSLTLNQGASASAGNTITEGANTFFMLPQTLPTGAEVEITLKDSLTNTSRTLTKSIDGRIWKKGKTIVYKVSTSSINVTPNFTLSPNTPLSTTYTGGALAGVTLTSEATVTGGGAAATSQVAWTAQYSTDNGTTWSSTAPSWLSGIGATGTGNATLSGTVTAQKYQVVNSHNTALKAKSTLTSPIDLSTGATWSAAATPQNTANCYIVNAPGTYYLPLVYGNAIKNGGDNTAAYRPTVSGSNVLSPLQNHAGVGITKPYISENGITPDNATLVWMDADSLITNISYVSDGKGYIKFDVPQKHIQQGNAILAIRTGNTILWSWHIWVTDYVLGTGNATITGSDKAYTFMSQNIGWCDPATYTYPERSVQIKFTQKGTNAAPLTLTVTQNLFSFPTMGDAPYFQWGRKDPMLPYILAIDASGTVIAANSADKFSYPTTNSYSFQKTGNQVSIATAIQNPHTYYYNVNAWSSIAYANLWSINETTYNNANALSSTTTPVKTIYDPSPVGYKVPTPHAYNRFTQSGSNWNSVTKMNTLTSGGSIVLPALAGRYYATGGNVSSPGEAVWYWSALPFNQDNGWAINTYVSNVYPATANARSFALPVRAIKE